MQQYLAAILFALASMASAARAEISTSQWREMNSDFQAAYIQGVLGAASAFGATESLREPMDAGMKCLAQRKWTASQIVQRFTPYLERRLDLIKQPLPMAFLDYMLDACSSDGDKGH